MELRRLPYELTVCKVESLDGFDWNRDVYFIGRTNEETSLVCKTEDTPAETLEREDGWKGFRVQGTLDFSLIGILSGISSVLAEAGIGIFAISTYDTDYILVKAENFAKAADALAGSGYSIID